MKFSIKNFFIFEGEEEKKIAKNINIQNLKKDSPKPGPEITDLKSYYQHLYQELEQKSEQGPIFSQKTLEFLKRYPQKLQKNEAIWMANVVQQGLPQGFEQQQFANIFDWVRAERIDLKRYSLGDARQQSDEWHKQFEGNKEEDDKLKYKTNDIVKEFSNGYKMVQIKDPGDLKIEGDKMDHCVGRYGKQVESGRSLIYSLRDSQNNPHITIEIQPPNRIAQVFGKKNNPPSKKYYSYLWEFLKDIDIKQSLKFAPPEILAKLAEDEDEDVRLKVARNPNAPPEILAKLAEDDVRVNVSKNPNLSPEMWAKLIFHYTRREVALNPNTPTEILAKLAEDKNEDVRVNVPKNPNTPSEVLAKLADDEDIYVRVNVSKNPNTPSEVLAKLAKDKEVYVRTIANQVLQRGN